MKPRLYLAETNRAEEIRIDVPQRFAWRQRRRLAGPEGARGAPGKNAAFTLLELLVVIAIIGILAALLLPSLTRAQKAAQGRYCMNNGNQMIKAVHLYANDNSDWLPPNPEHGTNSSWVAGTMKIPEQATNTLLLTDARYAKLAPYTAGNPALYHCPADHSTVTIGGVSYPRVRTFSMNQAVGTKPLPPRQAVDAPWLDGHHGNLANAPWRTYGRFADMTVPSPSDLWVLLDEDECSINDAQFAVSMALPTAWIDVPGSYHNFACGIAFADAHSEIHKWTDPRTAVGARIHQPGIRNQPGNRDILWLQRRTSSNALTGEPH